MLKPFFIALQFLTLLPSPRLLSVEDEQVGRSLPYYPLVGLILGLILSISLELLSAISSIQMLAALILTIWVALTGALHLDGLADSADAWLGGRGDRERSLAIMKDSACGPAGVVILILILLMKYAAIQNIASNNNWHLLLFIPALARTAPPLLFLTTPYVRVDGIGSALSRHLPRFATAASILFTAATFLVFTQTRGLIIILFASCAFIIIRALLIRWIGGTTGDTAGAMIESIETILLLGSPLFR